MFPFLPDSVLHRPLEASLARLRHSNIRLRKMDRLKVGELEDELARTTLLVHALSELCVKKGLLTNAELASQIAAAGSEEPESPT